jgi:hypothetical protein
MATVGNLELRLFKNTLYSSCTHDGYKVYEIVPYLASFFENKKNPTSKQYRGWFKEKAKLLTSYKHYNELLGGCAEEVIIDVPRKLIIHTADSESLRFVSKQFPLKFKRACNILKSNYSYSIVEYVPLLLRE